MKIKIDAPVRVEFKTPYSAGFDIPAKPSTEFENELKDGLQLTRNDLEVLHNEATNWLAGYGYSESRQDIINRITYYHNKNKNIAENISIEDFITAIERLSITTTELNKPFRIICPWETGIIRTKIYTEIPQGYQVEIRPRSGISCKHHWQVQIGTIDADYRGEWGVIFQNKSNIAYLIEEGDRVAQGIYQVALQPEFEYIARDEFDKSERGEGGFGSTGK